MSEAERLMAPHRVQLSRKRGWWMPPNTVSVARPGKCSAAIVRDGQHLPIAGDGGRTLAHDLAELAGKNLGCWCALNAACHADVLLELANAPATLTTDIGQRL